MVAEAVEAAWAVEWAAEWVVLTEALGWVAALPQNPAPSAMSALGRP
jgi:hypothetical protein